MHACTSTSHRIYSTPHAHPNFFFVDSACSFVCSYVINVIYYTYCCNYIISYPKNTTAVGPIDSSSPTTPATFSGAAETYGSAAIATPQWMNRTKDGGRSQKMEALITAFTSMADKREQPANAGGQSLYLR